MTAIHRFCYIFDHVFHFHSFLGQATQSLARAHTRTVSVRWAVWNPFSYQSTPEVSLALVGGATQAPVQTFVYRLPVMDMQDKMTALTAGGLMAFRFAMGAKVVKLILFSF